LKRVKTGVEGLDGLLGGGLMKGSSTVLVGPAGSLKSFIGQQFIYKGLKSREPCVYVSITQDFDSVEEQVRLNFGWSFKRYLRKGCLKFVDLYSLWMEKLPDVTKPLDLTELMDRIFEAEEHAKGGRELLNNFSSLFNFAANNQTVLRMAHAIRAKAKKAGTTVLFLLDEGAQDKNAEENLKSLCDYVLVTDVRGSDVKIRVTKSLTRHSLEWHDLNLTKKGVIVEVIH